MSDKSEWPEVVGFPGEQAKTIILNDDPTVNAQVIPEGSPVTMDYRTDRVRILVDGSGIVVSVPIRG